MKVFKVELLIIDHDEVGAKGISNEIENAIYGNRCISPKVKNIEAVDIGEWTDDHPLNQWGEVSEKEYRRLFPDKSDINNQG